MWLKNNVILPATSFEYEKVFMNEVIRYDASQLFESKTNFSSLSNISAKFWLKRSISQWNIPVDIISLIKILIFSDFVLKIEFMLIG